jgi:hypothetical protein
MSSLFDLTEDLRHLESVVSDIDPEGELPPDVVAWLDAAEGNYAQKVEGYCAVVGQLEAVARARSEEAERLRSLATVTQRQVDRLKLALKESLLKLERPKVETTRYKVWVQPAGGKQPLQIIEEEVPHDLKKVELVVDKDKIRDLLESGNDLPYARLLPRGYTLRIK